MADHSSAASELFVMPHMRAPLIAGVVWLAASAAASAQQGWQIVELKPPKNDSDQLSAVMVVGDAALILRCRNQTTEAAFSTKDTVLGEQTVTVRYRINSENPIKEVWRSSMDGRAAFAPNPVNFIRALPDNGRVFIRALAADGQNKDANFKLADVSEVRDKIGHACNWSTASGESTGSVDQPQAR